MWLSGSFHLPASPIGSELLKARQHPARPKGVWCPHRTTGERGQSEHRCTRWCPDGQRRAKEFRDDLAQEEGESWGLRQAQKARRTGQAEDTAGAEVCPRRLGRGRAAG